MKTVARVLGLVAALLFVVWLGISWYWDFREHNEVKEYSRCLFSLETIAEVLVEYGRDHAAYPKTPEGLLDLTEIFRATQKTRTAKEFCPSNQDVDCYVFRANLKPSDLDPEADNSWSIIAMDLPSNHPIDFGVERGKFRVNVLSGERCAVPVILTKSQAESFQSKLERGEIFHEKIFER